MQTRQALLPACFGRHAWGEELDFEATSDPAVEAGGLVAGGLGLRVLYLRESGAAGPAGQITVSAERLAMHISCEDGASDAVLLALGDHACGDDDPLVTPLSQLRYKKPWTRGARVGDTNPRRVYHPPGRRLHLVLATSTFAGELPAPPRQLPVDPGRTFHENLGAAASVKGTEAATTELRLEAKVHAGGRCVWRGVATPDAVVTEKGAKGTCEERLLRHACCVVYELSANLSSCDAGPSVLQALVVGIILCMAREARRREYVDSGTPLPGGGLVRPAVVACLPCGWGDHADDEEQCARVYTFEARLDGVHVRRSAALTVRQALDFVYSAVSS